MAGRGDRSSFDEPALTIQFVAETGSTNADMLALVANGMARDADWLVAESQTGGRGRMGRAWESPDGNFYGSTLVAVRAGDPPPATLALAAGIAVHNALSRHTPGLTLKWPNDVLAGRAKVAGVLLERSGDWVVIGAGVNLVTHPDLPDRSTNDLAALGTLVSPRDFTASLAEDMSVSISRWRHQPLASTIAAWEAVAHPMGSPLDAAWPDGERMAGKFDGLTAEGALRLRLPSGEARVIHAGDVFQV
ncbi:biotin--[biotin carboxyl-carrier protein] ligase [Sphingomonas antarctica]|uniref:biotin--[acetyl-CoA-carboxylase] ligase n=1 Tax=Sphingomonas antarctica TaxID=2040274 RepID=UPI0039ECBF12